jgi:FkbM family methyltransferase
LGHIRNLLGSVRRRLFGIPADPGPVAHIDALRARVAVDPNDHAAWLALACRYVEIRRFDEAEHTFARVLELRQDREVWLARGNLEAQRGRPDAACAWFSRVCDSNPDDADAWMALGTMQVQRGRATEATESFLNVIRARPADLTAWGALGSVLCQSGKDDVAADALRSALGILDPAGALARDKSAHDYRNRTRLVLVDLIDALLPRSERFVILDGGAREALADPRLLVLEPSRLVVHGFEPDAGECERLNRQARERGLDLHYHAVGLWSADAVLPFEENNAGAGSSFLYQNRVVTDRWRFESRIAVTNSPDLFYPTKIVNIPVTSVANWAANAGVDKIDFIKLNVQGAELEILRGCGAVLDGVAGILLEVSFVESYKDRPMFADLDVWLRDHGFTFFDLIGHHYVGRAASPFVARQCHGLAPHWGELVSFWGQLIEGHALYFRDPIAAPMRHDTPLDVLETRTLKLACLAEIFGQVEYAFELVAWLRDQAAARSDADLASRMAALGASANERYQRFVCWGALPPVPV